MKKTILQTLTTVLLVGVFMSSCLGESNMKTTVNGPVYIKKFDGAQNNVAISNAIVFTDDFVNKLTYGHGRFYYLNATVNTKDGRSPEGAYYASSVSYRQGEERPVVAGRYTTGDTPPAAKEGDVYLTGVDVGLFSAVATSGIDDRWLFEYKANVFKRDTDHTADFEGFDRDNIRLVATVYDKDQFEYKGEKEERLPANKVVVRLSLERVDSTIPPTETKPTTATSGASSISLSDLRRRFYDMDEEKLTIQFIYTPEPDKDGNAREDVRIGSWEESYKHYYMFKEKS